MISCAEGHQDETHPKRIFAIVRRRMNKGVKLSRNTCNKRHTMPKERDLSIPSVDHQITLPGGSADTSCNADQSLFRTRDQRLDQDSFHALSFSPEVCGALSGFTIYLKRCIAKNPNSPSLSILEILILI